MSTATTPPETEGSVKETFSPGNLARRVIQGDLSSLRVVFGLILLAWELTGSPGTGELIAALGIVGAGNGLMLPPLLGAALTEVGPAQAGAASGALNTAQQFANSLGVTVVGTVFFAVAGRRIADAASAMQVVVVLYVALMALIIPLVRLGWPRPVTAEM